MIIRKRIGDTLRFRSTSLAAVLILFFLSTFLLGCQFSKPGNLNAQPSPTTGSQPSPTIRTTTDEVKNISERKFTFVVQGGKKINAIVTENPSSDKKMVTFDPFLEPTDGNLYNAALMILSEIYGKQRGLIQLKDARTKDVSGLGKAACWEIFNPTQSYCVSHLRVSDTDKRLAGLVVWTE